VSQPQHFAQVAPCYDELRPPAATPGPLDDAILAAGRHAGKHVLDIGCGTGRGLRVLVDHYGCTVAGLDASAEMLRAAREKLPDADLRHGRAENLPFEDEAFDAATMVSAAHHVDRPPAFAEARRVLRPGGRLVVCNLDPASLERWWIVPFFPSCVAVESRRMPTLEQLAGELDAAGLRPVVRRRVRTQRAMPREEALAKIRGRAYSTFDLLGEDEYRQGLERAERELPPRVDNVLGSLVVAGER
jgi:ubiquinone/menaquinone biosynthesis C-methylase UbiE